MNDTRLCPEQGTSTTGRHRSAGRKPLGCTGVHGKAVQRCCCFSGVAVTRGVRICVQRGNSRTPGNERCIMQCPHDRSHTLAGGTYCLEVAREGCPSAMAPANSVRPFPVSFHSPATCRKRLLQASVPAHYTVLLPVVKEEQQELQSGKAE